MENMTLKSMPVSLLDCIKAKKPAKIKTGSRNDSLFRIGAAMRAKGASEQEIFTQLALMNLSACEEPLDVAEVERIAASAAKISPTESGGDESWRNELRLSAKGIVLAILVNVVLILRCAAMFKGRFAYDEFSRKVFVRAFSHVSGVDVELDNAEVLRTQHAIQELFGCAASSATVFDAIVLVASDNKFHPVKDHLRSLKWDGVERLPTWLQKVFGAADNAYVSLVGIWFMIQAVARIFLPGCKADYTMILVSGQGLRKSTACRLLGGIWYSDSQLDLHSKDAFLTIAGRWIQELAEFEKLIRHDSAVLKAFLTSAEDRFRPPYGKAVETWPRSCVFIGTTNETRFLKDPTGGRRFWAIECLSFDEDYLRAVRDQLFAEAVARFDRDDRWWPDTELEHSMFTQEQDQRFVEDVLEEVFESFLRTQCRNVRPTVKELIVNALGISDPRDWSKALQTRVGQVMQRLNWQPNRVMRNGQRVTEYHPPETFVFASEPEPEHVADLANLTTFSTPFHTTPEPETGPP